MERDGHGHRGPQAGDPILERRRPENSRDEALLGEARAEILASTGGDPPSILDPFAGGGTIPLDAQRLGLEAHASDLNPVGADQQGPDRDPAYVRRTAARIPRVGRRAVGLGGCDRPSRRRPRVRGVDARRGTGAYWRALPPSNHPRRFEGDCDRLDLGADSDLPEPCLRDRDAARALVVAEQEEGQGGMVRPIIAAEPQHPSGKRVQFEISHGAAGPASDDRITSVDSSRDRVNCGSGRDTVLADRHDIVSVKCERVRRR